MSKIHYRTIWISDLHLGSSNCKVEQIHHFLSSVKADTIFLVGDIIDGWALQRSGYKMPQNHVNILRMFLSKAKNETKIFYAVGNHDEVIRHVEEFFPFFIGNIAISNEFEYQTLKNGKVLVFHGDLYDCIIKMHRWVAIFGDISYTFLVKMNKIYNRIRKKMGYPYWSFSNYAKQKVKKALEFITQFECIVAEECRKRCFNGVICGHIHTPTIKNFNDVVYYNTGDWVENCTALVEHDDGTMEIIYYDVQ